MKAKDAKNIKILAESMDWDDLALMIIELELEFHELKGSISKKELADRLEELEIYENTKTDRVLEQSDPLPRTMMMYGEDFVSAGNDDEDLY